MDLARYTDLFLEESREHLASMNRELLELERAHGSVAPVQALFRAVHTLKGMAATMGFSGVAELAHAMEALLDRARQGAVAATPAVIEVCLEGVDALERLVEEAASGRGSAADVGVLARLQAAAGADTGTPAGRDAPLSLAPAPGPGEALPETRHVRVDVRRLDALTDLVGELTIARGRVERIAGESAGEALHEALERSGRLLDELHDAVMRARLVPVSQVCARLPRLVRDAAAGLGRDVTLAMEGRDIEVDRSLLDALGDSLVHLLRNAVDHGLETPADRERAGKPATGLLELSFARERGALVVRVRDDGRGVDRAAVAARAAALGARAAQEGVPDDAELLELLARPGLSTADRVTELSGRGVGLDVVMHTVRALGGTVELVTAPGQGTTVTLRLPLTVAIVRGLIVRVADEAYAIPLAHVSEAIELPERALASAGGGEVLRVRGASMPVLRLRDVVGLPAARRDAEQVVVVEMGDRRAGLVVDELTAQQDIVVKRFDRVRASRSLFSGATILGDGEPALIVDIGDLMRGGSHG